MDPNDSYFISSIIIMGKSLCKQIGDFFVMVRDLVCCDCWPSGVPNRQSDALQNRLDENLVDRMSGFSTPSPLTSEPSHDDPEAPSAAPSADAKQTYEDLSEEEKEKVDKVINSLNTIGQLKEGDKVYIDNDMISVDESYVPNVSRWWYSQGAELTIAFLNKLLDSTEKYIYFKNIDEKLREAKLGVINIKATYKDRQNVCDECERLLMRIDRILINVIA